MRDVNVRLVETTHNEADDGLCEETNNHGPLRSKVVNHECTNDGSRHVEQTLKLVSILDSGNFISKEDPLDHNVPSKDNTEFRRSASDTKQA